jgi:hypothetical protein
MRQEGWDSAMMPQHCLFAALLTALSLACPSALANGMSEGVEVRQAVDGVTIYSVRDEFIAEDMQPPAQTININTTVKVVIVRRSARWDQYHRALGQLYTGFIKVYAGPRYPF